MTGAEVIALVPKAMKALKALLGGSDNDKVIELYKTQLDKSEARNLELEKKNEELRNKLERCLQRSSARAPK